MVAYEASGSTVSLSLPRLRTTDRNIDDSTSIGLYLDASIAGMGLFWKLGGEKLKFYDWSHKKRVRQDLRTLLIVLMILGTVETGFAIYNYYKIQSYGPRVNHVPVRPTDQGCGPAGSAGPVCPWTGGGSGGTGVHGVVLM